MKYIWAREPDTAFVEVKQIFTAPSQCGVLRISADYRYVAYINGKFAACGQYADIPEYKSVDEVQVSEFLQEGENEIFVLAWHMGKDFSICRTMSAGVAFEIISQGEVIAQTDEHTLCRPATGYIPGDIITLQLGYGYGYDFTMPECTWEKCCVVPCEYNEVARPIADFVIGESRVPKIAAQGVFLWKDSSGERYETAAEKMQNAWLSTVRFFEMTGMWRPGHDVLHQPISFEKKEVEGNGIFIIADLGEEVNGHLFFSVKVKKACNMYLGWGEHLADLRVRTAVGGRNFASEFVLQKGENTFRDYLRRIGGRYICLFIESEEATLQSLGIEPSLYPFAMPKKDFGDRLLNQIYETGRKTLSLCAHEHYEDCPWREQGLYGMDSRNQMLFGYGAFEEYEYPRANLRLIARTLREDGLIELCAPAQMTITIPVFTAYWLIAICENAEADYDEEFVREILPYAETALETFFQRMTSHGLSIFTKVGYWNFHEWSSGLDGTDTFMRPDVLPKEDCNLTALVYRAAKGIAALEETVGNRQKADDILEKAEQLGSTLEYFYDKDRGLYASYLCEQEKKGYHAYTQAIMLSTGLVPTERNAVLCKAIKGETKDVVAITFAALQMKYEALIEYGDGLQDCIEEICNIFGKMLFSGATSYWETEKGEADFEDAGSLCHGWSAVACYVLDKYGGKRK